MANNMVLLHDSISQNNFEKIREILQSDKSCINDWNQHFVTPLQALVQVFYSKNDDKLLLLQYLIDCGADVNIQAIDSVPALFYAVRNNQLEVVKKLLENGANPNILDHKNENALACAEIFGVDIDIVKILLEYKANPNIIDSNDLTVLDHAVINQKLDHVQLLVEFGAKSNNIYKILLMRWSRTEYDLQKNISSLFKYLLMHAAKMDSHGRYSHKTLFYYLCCTGVSSYKTRSFANFMRKLDENIDDNVVNSSLHFAAFNQDEAMVKDLLRNGENVNVKNFFDDTPLHVLLKSESARSGESFERIVNLLIENDADLRALNFLDETPFYVASKVCGAKFVKPMLAKITGVNEILNSSPAEIPRLCNGFDKNEPKLPELIFAVAFKNEQVIDRLIDIDYIEKASKNCCQDINHALGTAVHLGQYNIVKMIKEAGFKTNGHLMGKIPYIERGSESHMKLTCLFWEYKEVTTVNRLIQNNLHSITRGLSADRLTYLISFLHSIDSYLRKSNAAFISESVNALFKSQKEVSHIYPVCKQQLEDLKQIQMGDVSIFNFMTTPLNSLVKLSENIDRFNSFKYFLSTLEEKVKLEYFEYAIKIRLDLVVEKRKLLNIAKDQLNEIFQDLLNAINFTTLPDDVMWKILCHLNTRDLKKLAKVPTVIHP